MKKYLAKFATKNINICFFKQQTLSDLRKLNFLVLHIA